MTWVAVGAAAVSVVGGYLVNKQNQKAQAKAQSQYQAAADPYAPYRDQAAQKLNALMNDPTSITTTPEYKARLDAAARTMAAQGYTGSGNALAAAAQAGGDVYQQAFNNLALTSGAGQNPAIAAGGSADLAMQSANNNANNQSQLINTGVYWGQKAYNAWQGNSIPSTGYQSATGAGAPTYSGSDLNISYDV